MTMPENVKNEITRAPEEEGPDFDKGLYNSRNYTNLLEQRPPVDSTARVASTYSMRLIHVTSRSRDEEST
ncbi:hypothetical protein TNCV_2200051 [Trichonephila clavipes]|nr:hypothetical protein TNCV_2200051 [Trichonephila clavipes]